MYDNRSNPRAGGQSWYLHDTRDEDEAFRGHSQSTGQSERYEGRRQGFDARQPADVARGRTRSQGFQGAVSNPPAEAPSHWEVQVSPILPLMERCTAAQILEAYNDSHINHTAKIRKHGDATWQILADVLESLQLERDNHSPPASQGNGFQRELAPRDATAAAAYGGRQRAQQLGNAAENERRAALAGRHGDRPLYTTPAMRSGQVARGGSQSSLASSTAVMDKPAAVELLFTAHTPLKLYQPQWRYIDQLGKTQGPFDPSEMIEWHKNGFLRDDLMVMGVDKTVTNLKDASPSLFQPLGMLLEKVMHGEQFHPLKHDEINNLAATLGAATLGSSIAREPSHGSQGSYNGRDSGTQRRAIDSGSRGFDAATKPTAAYGSNFYDKQGFGAEVSYASDRRQTDRRNRGNGDAPFAAPRHGSYMHDDRTEPYAEQSYGGGRGRRGGGGFSGRGRRNFNDDGSTFEPRGRGRDRDNQGQGRPGRRGEAVPAWFNDESSLRSPPEAAANVSDRRTASNADQPSSNANASWGGWDAQPTSAGNTGDAQWGAPTGAERNRGRERGRDRSGNAPVTAALTANNIRRNETRAAAAAAGAAAAGAAKDDAAGFGTWGAAPAGGSNDNAAGFGGWGAAPAGAADDTSAAFGGWGGWGGGDGSDAKAADWTTQPSAPQQATGKPSAAKRSPPKKAETDNVAGTGVTAQKAGDDVLQDKQPNSVVLNALHGKKKPAANSPMSPSVPIAVPEVAKLRLQASDVSGTPDTFNDTGSVGTGLSNIKQVPSSAASDIDASEFEALLGQVKVVFTLDGDVVQMQLCLPQAELPESVAGDDFLHTHDDAAHIPASPASHTAARTIQLVADQPALDALAKPAAQDTPLRSAAAAVAAVRDTQAAQLLQDGSIVVRLTVSDDGEVALSFADAIESKDVFQHDNKASHDPCTLEEVRDRAGASDESTANADSTNKPAVIILPSVEVTDMSDDQVVAQLVANALATVVANASAEVAALDSARAGADFTTVVVPDVVAITSSDAVEGASVGVVAGVLAAEPSAADTQQPELEKVDVTALHDADERNEFGLTEHRGDSGLELTVQDGIKLRLTTSDDGESVMVALV